MTYARSKAEAIERVLQIWEEARRHPMAEWEPVGLALATALDELAELSKQREAGDA